MKSENSLKISKKSYLFTVKTDGLKKTKNRLFQLVQENRFNKITKIKLVKTIHYIRDTYGKF